ncbi:MAG: HEAT repeat domain-containing protein [Myxococcota bacterium]
MSQGAARSEELVSRALTSNLMLPLLLGLSLEVVACAPSGPVRAALYGDLPSLREEIRRAEREGHLGRADVKRLARAVAERETASATGKSGVRHVRALSACGAALLPALRRRSEQHDEVGASAMLARISLRDIATDKLVSEYARAADPAWRAVAARSAVSAEDVLLRRAWFTDTDQRVRQAAFEAAALAPAPEDLQHLLEAFRLDPDPTCRSRAAHAAGSLGGEASVLGLADRFARADQEGQLTIVEAWSMPASFKSGGSRELSLIAAQGRGLVSIAAIHALLRLGERDGSLAGLLATAIEQGSEEEQRLAMLQAPLGDARIEAAIVKASTNSNPEVRVIALSRLLEVPARAPKAKQALKELSAKRLPVAAEARAALAFIGDRSVVRELVAEAQTGPAWSRARAASALFRLGESARAAATLADSDPGVRIGTACSILASRD